ncbi:unnamed protein product, partial [Urochloa humidicola]
PSRAGHHSVLSREHWQQASSRGRAGRGGCRAITEPRRGEEKASSTDLIPSSVPPAAIDRRSGIAVAAAMEEAGRGRGACGLLKVLVARGRNLAVRDFTSSDPYVIVRAADTTAKTKVINSCLNPVWNEEMTFSMKEPVGVIKFEVFDWDRFKYDDKMGHAFLDLQPVAAATKLRRALRLTTGETKLRKVAPDADNCLLSDSFVTYANGEVALDAWLRLRDVESGELFITVKWIEAEDTK